MMRRLACRLKGSTTLVAAGVLLLVTAWLWAAAPASAVTQTWDAPTFADPPGPYSSVAPGGYYYDWVVPAGVTQATFDLFGAAGGDAGVGPVVGGSGGETVGTIAVQPGETLTIYVGGQPGYGGPNSGGVAGHGYCSVVNSANQQCLGASGGGGSDVRQGGTALSNRVLVAGGGGGAGGTNTDVNGNCNCVAAAGGRGGDGGALVAGWGSDGGGQLSVTGGCGGVGGTQTLPSNAPEDAACTPGVHPISYQPGVGGPGGNTGTNDGGPVAAGSGGGGGGGYFGGGGGGYGGGSNINGGQPRGGGGGGGGGSSFASVAATNVSFSAGVRSGNGRVTVTYDAAAPTRTLTISKSGSGDGTVTGAGIDCGGGPAHVDCTETVANGTAVALTATPAAGSAFSTFTGGGCASGANPCTVVLDADKAVDAGFVASHTLTITTSGTGSGTITGPGIDCGGGPAHVDCTETVSHGSTLVLNATSAAGSAFGTFTGGGCSAGANPCTVTLDADKAVGARFDLLARHILTITTSGTGSGTVSGSGIDCGGGAGHVDCTESVLDGSTVTLSATGAGGSQFQSFSGGGCVAGANPCTVKLDAEKTVDAAFALISLHTLTVTTSGTGAGTVTGTGIDCGGPGHLDCTETVSEGNTITLTAVPVAGDEFTGYAGGGCAGVASCTVTLDVDKAVDAGFGQPPGPLAGIYPLSCPQLGNLLVGTGAGDALSGTPLNDVIDGQAGSDRLRGLGGGDCLYGAEDDDRLFGGVGNDQLFGAADSDRLQGEAGIDALSGDSGNDVVSGGTGADRLSGGTGDDRMKGGSGRDRISGEHGKDRITSRDQIIDKIDCGSGLDAVIADRHDRVARNCERVSRQ